MTQNIESASVLPSNDRSISRMANIIAWILQARLALAFLGSAGAKLAGVPEMVKEFGIIGLGQWFRYVTAICELVGVIGLLLPRTTFYAAVWLGAIMFFAVIAHLTRLHTNPAPPIVFFVLCSALAYLRRR